MGVLSLSLTAAKDLGEIPVFPFRKMKLIMTVASSGGCGEETSDCLCALSPITVQARRTTALQVTSDLGFQIPAASLFHAQFDSGRVTSSH